MSIISKTISSSVGLAGVSQLSKQYLLRKVEDEQDTILQPDQFPNTTILLPTLNEEWMIENTLKSIKSQNIYREYPDKFEILVIDSESEDNTVEIAKKYLNSTDKIIIMEERNLVKARTVAIEHSMGDLIVFVDADTIYPVNWLNSMLKHYHTDLDVIAVSGPELHPGIHPIIDIYEPFMILFGSKLGMMSSNPMIGHNSSVYKWAFNMVDGFSVPFEYDIKSSKDTQVVLEKYFAEKLKNVGKYIYDIQLMVYDYGGKRRFLYRQRQRECGTDELFEKNKYICKYWQEREKRIRF